MHLSRWQFSGIIAILEARACEQALRFTVHDIQPLFTRQQPSPLLSLEDSSSNSLDGAKFRRFFFSFPRAGLLANTAPAAGTRPDAGKPYVAQAELTIAPHAQCAGDADLQPATAHAGR